MVSNNMCFFFLPLVDSCKKLKYVDNQDSDKCYEQQQAGYSHHCAGLQ
jgi:hypothetical protein